MTNGQERDEGIRKSIERESGLPGGGQGRIDEVGLSGVYPGSGPWPTGADNPVPGLVVHGQTDAEGREVEGGSELIYFQGQTLLGGATPPPGPAHGQSKSSMIPRDGGWKSQACGSRMSTCRRS